MPGGGSSSRPAIWILHAESPKAAADVFRNRTRLGAVDFQRIEAMGARRRRRILIGDCLLSNGA
jgi:hypothetical protein